MLGNAAVRLVLLAAILGPLTAYAEEQRSQDLKTLHGTVVEKPWTKSYESWNAGGSEYYVLDVGQTQLPHGSRSAKEGVILRPSRGVPFEQFKKFKGKQVTVKGRFVEAKPYKPTRPNEQMPGDQVEQYPMEPTVVDGPAGKPILGPRRPAPRGSGFQVYEILSAQQSDVAPEGGLSDASISTEQLRKSLKASKEELWRRETGEESRWTIPTDLLRKRVKEYEALLQARKGTGDRPNSQLKQHPPTLKRDGPLNPLRGLQASIQTDRFLTHRMGMDVIVTHSNHLGETSEPPFLVPAPGRYRLEIVLYAGRSRDRNLDVSSKWADVPEVAANVKTKPESVLHQAEKALGPALSDLGEEVTFEYAENSPSLIAKYRSREFTVHGGSKTGAFSEKPHEVEGPDVSGFLLRIHAQDKGTVNQADVPQTIRQPYWRTDLDVTIMPETGHQLYWALAYGSRTDETLLNRVRAAIEGLGTPEDPRLSPPKTTRRKPDHLNLTLGWIADSDKQGEREYLFVLNGIVAYRTLEGLRRHVKDLPKGSTIRWAPGCCRMGDEPLLSSPKEMKQFRSLCESCGVTLEIIPSG